MDHNFTSPSNLHHGWIQNMLHLGEWGMQVNAQVKVEKFDVILLPLH